MKPIHSSWVSCSTLILSVFAFFLLPFAPPLKFSGTTPAKSGLVAQETQQSHSTAPSDDTQERTKQDTVLSKTGLKTIELKVGKGKKAKKGATVFVHYVGKFSDGSIFDQSNRRKRPFVFKLGAGEVIKGWDEGILGMKVGGKRILIVPASLGYGNKQYGPIPPNSTLYFEVELIDVR